MRGHSKRENREVPFGFHIASWHIHLALEWSDSVKAGFVPDLEHRFYLTEIRLAP